MILLPMEEKREETLLGEESRREQKLRLLFFRGDNTSVLSCYESQNG